MMQKTRMFPHVVLYKRSSNRDVIDRDMNRWVEIYRPEKIGDSPINKLAWLLEAHPEFVNLFYARIGRYSGIVGRMLVYLAKKTYQPLLETLRFAEPINSIGPGFFARVGFGAVVAAEKIGENCWINPGTTLGYRDEGSGLPVIGDNVYIGAGAKILGSVIVGDNVIVGANAVVTKNVPPNCTVAGVPARIIRRDGIRVKEALHASHPPAEAGT